jgi:hypothetical protein
LERRVRSWGAVVPVFAATLSISVPIAAMALLQGEGVERAAISN